ncbi:hypothetical protein PTKIN_Ptkin16aG0526300 [Pterospermum kingtungense]
MLTISIPTSLTDNSTRLIGLFMTRRRVFESVEEQDGNSLPVKNQTIFSRRKGGYLPEILRPGRCLGRWAFWGLMVLALMTLLAKFALLNTLQNLNIDREKLMFTTTRVVVDADEYKQISSQEKFSVRYIYLINYI